MPTVLGPRATYQYVSDSSKTYEITQRKADGDAIGNTAVAAGSLPSLPSRIKPRHVWMVDSSGKRRKIVCGTGTGGQFLSGGTVSVDEGFTITGRVGEKNFGTTQD